MSKSQRYSLRKAGAALPRLPKGPPSGRRQAPDHIAKRARRGAEHWNWKGDGVGVLGGRGRCLRTFKCPDKCERCDKITTKIDRHHRDENTANNERSNIEFLCRSCHRLEHAARRYIKRLRQEVLPLGAA